MADVVPCHHEIAAGVVATANDDVGMGMAGVEVIDGDPVELGIEVALHLRHEIANERLEIMQLGAVVGRHNEPELMRVGPRAFEKATAVDLVAPRIVQLTGLAIAGDTVALDVVEMGAGSAEIATGDTHVARLDDDAAAARRDQAGSGAGPGAHTALGASGRDVAQLPHHAAAVLAGLAEHLRGVALRAGTAGILDVTELGLKVVLGHETLLCEA